MEEGFLMKRIVLRRGKLPLAAAAIAALCVAGICYLRTVPVRAAAAPLQLPVPRPRPRGDRELMGKVQQLPITPEAGRSVVLAQVVQVDRPPRSVYERFKKEYPALDPEMMVCVSGGRFRVLETLAGPPAPMFLRVENPKEPSSPGDVFSHSVIPVTSWMRPGECWIVVCDPKTGKVFTDASSGTMWLSGPDDILLAIYRRHVAWMKEPDRDRAFAEMRATVLNPQEPAASRLGAFRSMWAFSARDASKNPYRVSMQDALAKLLIQPGLSHDLKLFALSAVEVDASHEIAPGSADALLLRHLLDIVETSQDRDIVVRAADRLYFVCIQSSSVDGKYAAVYFPEIIEALEKREAADQARSPDLPSLASGALSNLKLAGRRHLEDIQRFLPVVIRHQPPAQ
jgi:hypothetical protein